MENLKSFIVYKKQSFILQTKKRKNNAPFRVQASFFFNFAAFWSRLLFILSILICHAEKIDLWEKKTWVKQI